MFAFGLLELAVFYWPVTLGLLALSGLAPKTKMRPARPGERIPCIPGRGSIDSRRLIGL